MSYLPFDISTQILDQLDHVEDVDTLRSFSLSCSDLRAPSQRKLFHTIDLKRCIRTGFRQHPKQILRLRAILKSSPWIADYVRSFEFCLLREHFISGPSLIVARLGKILARLHHVTSLVWLVVGMDTLDWVSFCANDGRRYLWQAILGVLPRLIFLKIDKIGRFPLNIMTRRHVVLDVTEDSRLNISLAVVPENIGNGYGTKSRSPYPRIRNYHIGRLEWPRELEKSGIEGVQCLHSVDPPFVQFDFEYIRDLQVTWDEGRSLLDTEKIMSCAVMLKEFTCIGAQIICAARCVMVRVYEKGSFGLLVSPSSSFKGLSRLFLAHLSQSLTTLNVKVANATGCVSSYYDGRGRLESLLQELSTLGGRNNLEQLSITIDLGEYTSGVHEQNIQSLNAVISQEMFRSLRTIDIIINIIKSWRFSPMNVVPNQKFCSMDELELYLKKLYGRYCEGLQSMEGLRFSCKVTSEEYL